MGSVERAVFEYKYGPKEWRHDPAEIFQKTKSVRTRYVNVDGQLAKSEQTTQSFASALATVGADPKAGPPYLYADGNFHADAFEIFQTTRIVTKTYQAFSDSSYEVTVDDFDVLLNLHKISHEILDGKVPAAPTRRSAISALLQRPLIGQLQHQCEWVANSQPLDLPWAETQSQMSKAAKRQQQRDSAVLRSITIPMNVYVKPGQTGRLVDAGRTIDANHMIVGVKHVQNADTGQAMTQLDLEYWEGGA